mmetsp:Transcript_1073/g.2790  ORF Transcript_1073/g.2790 Transcript_1073/m.2790 type:complete len:83 (-) Transcript_1073:1118-1366(-)
MMATALRAKCKAANRKGGRSSMRCCTSKYTLMKRPETSTVQHKPDPINNCGQNCVRVNKKFMLRSAEMKRSIMIRNKEDPKL